MNEEKIILRGQIIEDVREIIGFSQTDLAKVLIIPVSLIREWENAPQEEIACSDLLLPVLESILQIEIDSGQNQTLKDWEETGLIGSIKLPSSPQWYLN